MVNFFCAHSLRQMYTYYVVCSVCTKKKKKKHKLNKIQFTLFKHMYIHMYMVLFLNQSEDRQCDFIELN